MRDETANDSSSEFPTAGAVIAAFGGIRPMAARLGVPVSTVQGWKQRDAIPDNRLDEIRAAAQADGIDLATLPDEAQDDEPAGAETGGETAAPEPSAEAAVQPTTDAPPAAPAQPQPRGGSGTAAAIAVLALLVAIGAAGWTWWQQQQAGSNGAAGQIAALENSLRSEIASVRSEVVKAASRGGDTAALDALGTRLDRLARKVDDLAAGGGDAALAGDLDDVKTAVTDMRSAVSGNTAAVASLRGGIDNTLSDISARLVAVENRDEHAAAVEARAVGLAIAAAEIRRTLRNGAPYAGELATLRALAGDDTALAPALDTLAGTAGKGVPTVAALARRFEALVGDVLAADRTRDDAVWYRQVLGRIGDVVSVRRIGGDASGDSADAIVARAEGKLADGDLAGVVAEVSALQGRAAEVAGPWLASAREALDAEKAVAAINAKALAALAGAKGQ
jgi:hypothetical protein